MITESLLKELIKKLSSGELTHDQVEQFGKCLWDASAVDLSLIARHYPEKLPSLAHDAVTSALS